MASTPTLDSAGAPIAAAAAPPIAAIAQALVGGALPGETDGLDEAGRDAAARFVAEAAAVRAPGRPTVRIDSGGAEGGRRFMRIAAINDDMPFLVDSVAGAIAAHGLAVDRILHPIVSVRRDADGRLVAILPADEAGERRESMIYMEVERADARLRRGLEAELGAVLADVRAATGDWPRLQLALREEAERLPDGEGAALLRWFLERHFTLVGHRVEAVDGAASEGLGILRTPDPALWDEATRAAALAYFAGGGAAPLLLKADRTSTVHRRAPLDLIVCPRHAEGRLAGLALHAGLWTSAALRAPSERVPVLRSRLAAIADRHGFQPASHAGKALHHALSALPHDLLIAIDRAALETLALTAMSLADRPRPKLVLVTGALGRHLFAFVWLPRDEVVTARRVAIGAMIADAAGAPLTSWSLDLDEGDLALVRFMFDLQPGGTVPDAGPLDAQLSEMLRGWTPAVEARLAAAVGVSRAARLALGYAPAFPPAYRNRYDPAEAAADIVRLTQLDGAAARSVRIARAAGGGETALQLKAYAQGGLIPLSEMVPVLENFGFRVVSENATSLDAERLGGRLGTIHDFALELGDRASTDALVARTAVAERAIADVLAGHAEDDAFNRLIVGLGLDPAAVALFRAWFRYLRQAGLPYGLATFVDAIRRAPHVAAALVDLFGARHDPARAGTGKNGDDAAADAARQAVEAGLADVTLIDDDRILRRILALIEATLRTNAFAPAANEALAFKFDSHGIPGLPAPVPWREIWVYSPRVEGIHLRSGPIARGGIRWSDRRDDFRTEILGLMKAQVVKNAVIVPTGAKGGFYPKQLPAPSDRDAWLREGTESYRVFIRALLSLTDNIVADAVVHPDGIMILDGDDPYFVVAADKGTASFSDIANALALERGYWLGDAFASGGSVGYDHKAMGITARGAWVSVTRHLAEMGHDVQRQETIVVGCGDMSGDVFGNGMLLSKSLKLVAAFDHRHIFLDPDPDPAASWAERARLFALPRSSWADYDASLISAGGGVFPRAQKQIALTAPVRARLGLTQETIDPSALIAAILKAPVDLLWFGGIGTYVKAAHESNADVGDPANDAQRVDGGAVRAKVIGEGANLGVTQAGRIAYAGAGGRLNTDFIDNSAGVDCSDNEVNIKIALNAEMAAGRLAEADRNAFLASMTDAVAGLVLEDNRLQTLALSLAERGGAGALPAQVRTIELLEASGRLDRAVEGLGPNEALLRRGQDGAGLTRPELAVLLSHAKLALQEAIERSDLAADPTLAPLLHAAFPQAMQARFGEAIDRHRLRGAIIATEMANRIVNRIGPVLPFALAEEEGASLAQVAGVYFAADAIFALEPLWQTIETVAVSEEARLALFDAAAGVVRLHLADLLRATPGDARPGAIAERLAGNVAALDRTAQALLKEEALSQAGALRERLGATGADPALVERIVRLDELDGVVGLAELGQRLALDPVAATNAYVRLGEALGLDWSKAAAMRFASSDPWERLLAAGLSRDFEQLRLDFLARAGGTDPLAAADAWLAAQAPRVRQFRALVDRARAAPAPTAAMLAQIAGQARVLLGR